MRNPSNQCRRVNGPGIRTIGCVVMILQPQTPFVTLLTEAKCVSKACSSTVSTHVRTMYEFRGCFFHGCLTCFPHQRHIATSPRRGDRTFQECFEATVVKQRRLEAAGFTVVVMWECRWNRDKKLEGTAQRMVENLASRLPLGTSQRILWRAYQRRQPTTTTRPSILG